MSRALRLSPSACRRLRAAVVAAVVAAVFAGTAVARAEEPAALGSLEQETLADGMGRLGVATDPAPQGKTVGAILVVNEEVFSRRDWLLQFFNHFHRTTREAVLAREVLLRPGQLYDQVLIDETIRNLRSPPAMIISGVVVPPPELSSVIAIVPVVSRQPGQVDLLVVTRDVWSLRFNTNFEYQANALTLLDTSLSENNLFGWRKYAAFRYRLDQGSNSFGPSYYNPNIHGTRLTLYAQATLWYGRDSGRYEGNSETASLRYPLFSLASRWGAGVDVTHDDTLIRGFLGNDLSYDYRRRRTIVDSSVVRSFGTSVIQRVTAGHLFDGRRYFAADADLPPGGLPTTERQSEPYLRYALFTPRYLIVRDLDTFDLRENLRLGPGFAARVSYGTPALGADFAALGLSAAASWAASPWGGYAKIAATGSTRLRDADGAFIDQSFTGEGYFATPIFGRLLRVVVDAKVGAVRADTQKARFYLGGTTGLRGYAINEINGTSMVVGHVELRSRPVPLPIFSQRVGGLLFWDVGGAKESFAKIATYHDFGVGIRWLIPQANASVLRFDWAVPTADATITHAGFPGRFTAGFEQIFDPIL